LQQIRRFLLLLFSDGSLRGSARKGSAPNFFHDPFPDLTLAARAAESAPDIVMVK